jgi:HPt (histidine-containing phosphotransfer) domain-containing protein
MTAHAMKGDRERCLAAGMDAYVSKPIDPGELFEAIDRVTSARPRAAAPRPEKAPSGKAFDVSGVLSRIGGDRDLFDTMVKTFLEICPRLMRDIETAVANKDSKGLEKSAHVLKGSIGNFETASAFERAQRLETMGRNRDLDQAVTEYARLEGEIARLKDALANSRSVNAA